MIMTEVQQEAPAYVSCIEDYYCSAEADFLDADLFSLPHESETWGGETSLVNGISERISSALYYCRLNDLLPENPLLEQPCASEPKATRSKVYSLIHFAATIFLSQSYHYFVGEMEI